MQTDLITVIIVTWNSMETIKDCLNSVFRQKDVDFEVVVVDNGSTDGSLEFIKEHYPLARTIRNTRNLGYSHANNQGVNIANGEYITLLNADAILSDKCLARLLAAIKHHPDVGSVSGKVLRINGMYQVKNHVIDSTGIVLNRKKFSPADRGEGQPDNGQYDHREYIFGVSGAAAFYSRKMLENIRINNEIFDEDFFSYYEDLDLAWRAQLFGWKCLYEPSAVIYHARKGPKSQNKMIYAHAFKNRYLCYIKNDPGKNFVQYLPFSLAYEMLRCIKRFVTEPYLVKSVFLTIFVLPKMLKKRRLIQLNRLVSTEYLKQFN